MTKGCSVSECLGAHDSHGFCGKHAHRFRRHGDPLGGTTDKNAAVKFVCEVAVKYNSDDCLKWPFGDNGKGYGVFHVKRQAVAAHVHICELVHGPRPTPKHEVAHSCGKGHSGCVNPCHLRWATRSENFSDKIIHGTVNRGVKNVCNKLTESDVRSIRLLLSKKTQRAIAGEFGVTQGAISLIARGVNWGWLQ